MDAKQSVHANKGEMLKIPTFHICLLWCLEQKKEGNTKSLSIGLCVLEM
jgi:hypothetical protein